MAENNNQASTKKSNKLAKIPLVDVNVDDIEVSFNFASTGNESLYEGRICFDAYASFMKGYDRDRMRGGGIREVSIGKFEFPIAEALNPAIIQQIKEAGYQRIMSEIDDFIYDEDYITDVNPSGIVANPGARFGNINGYEASTKKSKRADISKRLAKLGGFTKEDEDDDTDVEIEIETDDDDDVKVETEDEEESEKGCKSKKSLVTNKKRMKMKKGEDMPEDADDQQDQNEKGSGNAGSTLPEDADDQQDQNEAGSGSAGSDLPEDADDQQDIKESARKARLARMQKERNKSAKKSVPPVRKFSVTPGGQPNQESYNQRYQQSPMVRDAIDRGSSVEKFDERQMMQDRIDNLMKSHRNPTGNNGVPKKLR